VARPQVAAKPVAAGLAAVLALAGVVIAKWEGVRYVPYRDVVGVLTVCYGSTKNVDPAHRYTRAECEARLDADMREANGHVRRCVGQDMPVGVEAALTSLVFNVGPRGVCGSTLGMLARAGNWPATCAQLDRWKYAGGRVYRGLVLRRADERAVCEGRA
jgi:lysozyme